MEAPTGKVIFMIIAFISLILIPHSEACSALRNDGKFSEFAQNNQKGVMSPGVNLTKSEKVPFYSRKQ